VSFAVHRNSVIGSVANDVWLIITNEKVVVRIKQRQQLTCEASIAIVKEARVPRPIYACKNRSKTVQCDEYGRSARLVPAI
jgi:hypothetical protein